MLLCWSNFSLVIKSFLERLSKCLEIERLINLKELNEKALERLPAQNNNNDRTLREQRRELRELRYKLQVEEREILQLMKMKVEHIETRAQLELSNHSDLNIALSKAKAEITLLQNEAAFFVQLAMRFYIIQLKADYQTQLVLIKTTSLYNFVLCTHI